MRLKANEAWFTFTVEEGPEFQVYALSGQEEINKPYSFSVELVNRSANVDITSLLGAPACISIADHSGGKRVVHGLITEMEQLHTGNTFTHYSCAIVPRLHFLDKIREHRIFQNQSVVEIIQQILNEQGFPTEAVSFKLFFTYQPREYCVQYGETDLHFITRLCEEEGMFFCFEHNEDTHTLCFCDREGGPRIPGESNLRFFPGSGQAADTAVISRLRLRHKINSNAIAYREWNFKRPRLNLEVGKHESDQKAAPVPPGMLLEQYNYPHLYQLQTPGARYAELQLLRQLTFREWIEIESDASRFLPGYSFSIDGHPREDVNSDWQVVSVHHEGKQPGAVEHEGPDERGLYYKSSVTAIPKMTRFIPELEHPKAKVEGVQSAIVTGPAGEEVFTEEYGRVKVQFHWDRKGKQDENTTCWVRVADSWAGQNFGFIQLPRVGQECLVEFMEGDPDRPVITGRVYNTDNMPPWELPKQKALSGIQSREIKGGQRNQLVLDDTQGEVQAQLSSDHGSSQLNLGYITRVNHMTGRDDFRGEGFELRTDKWGVMRAANGLFVSTFSRSRAEKHHKDITEVAVALQQALEQHEAQGKFAVEHQAQTEIEDLKEIVACLQQQLDEIKDTGQKHSELSTPQVVVASSSGAAISANAMLQLRGATHTMLTSGGHTSMASGASLFATALEKISLFAHKAGMKIFAAGGKIAIQAQSDAIDVIADQVLKLISSQKSVEISAAEEIKLSCGGSYLKINSKGIEQGTGGKWTAHAAGHTLAGPKQEPVILPNFNLPGENWMGLAVFGDNLQPIEGVPIKYTTTFLDRSVRQGELDSNGRAHLENVPPGFATVTYEFPPPHEIEREPIDALLPLYYEMLGVL